MEFLAAVILFATLATGLTFFMSRFWARPKAAIDRVTRAAAEAHTQPPQHPSLVFRDLVKRLGALVPKSPADSTVVQQRLVKAGFRASAAVGTFYGAKVTLAAAGVLLATVASVRSPVAAERKLMTIAVAAAAGFLAPNQFVRMAIRRRQRQIRRGLPNALDLLVVCVESGLGLDQAIVQAAKELEHAHPEISQEFTLVNLELRAGKRRVEALRNLADRTGVDELKKLVAVLIQADRFGTGVAQSLRSHSEYMRVQARQTAEEKAAKLGVKLVFPIFFCILPSLFVVTVGPVMVRISRELLPMMKSI
ncbi:MAG TPA: type II secretion system F family protein [Bryobacteraceae bacterium]|nr:type II secretion system F family protein [Bryobacteraceae bacterium]